MQIKDIMTKDVITVESNRLIVDVAKLLITNRIHGIPVVEDKKVLGIITETDFFTKGSVNVYLPTYIDFLEKNDSFATTNSEKREEVMFLLNARAVDIMSAPCVVINENSETSEFLGVLKGRKLNTVPVVNDGNEIVGIITLADIINLIKL